jgi:hypothetical protein
LLRRADESLNLLHGIIDVSEPGALVLVSQESLIVRIGIRVVFGAGESPRTRASRLFCRNDRIRTSERKLLLLRRERRTVRTLSRRDERVHLRR